MYRIIANGCEVASTRDFSNATGLVELLALELGCETHLLVDTSK